ncbi:ABC transporter ATP-binding protein [Streptomyces sp. NPDC090106]|uniref:ABC transporter ATP-binding protein n=1 Tax=Streptomyces sp. NPDC090106 TaxID=3365946 RepID=UPI00381E4D5B
MNPPGKAGGRSVFRLLLSYVRPHRWTLLTGTLLSLVSGAAALLLPLVARGLIDDLAHDRSITGKLLAMAALVVADAVMAGLGGYVLRRAAESVVLGARRALSSYLLRLRIAAMDRVEPGDLMARITSDTTLLREVTTDSLVALGTGGITLVATLVMMGVVDPVLLAVTLVVMTGTGAVLGTLVPRINRASRRAQDAVGVMGASLERVLGVLRTVKASGAEHREERVLHEAAEESWRQSVRAAKWVTAAGNTAGLAMQLAFITVLAVGGARVATGAIEVSTLVAFLLYVFYLLSPIQQVVGAVTQYQTGAAALERIDEALRLPSEPAAEPVELPASDAGPLSVVFDNVHFRYAVDQPYVHDGVGFAVPARGMTAFVGPSGSGKSTVFSLIERFYDPESGTVFLDGRPLPDWELPRLRAAIAYVEQDAPVLSGSLRDNLLLGNPGADESAVRRVLVRTRLDRLVARLPQGLETPVGHRGTKLSGGERQRLAIARALLRRPRLLLLDEATSQLDAVNEAALRDTVADVARSTTVLVVAHRLSTVTMADRIVVMDSGWVRSVGTHGELVEGDPLYAELAATQLLISAR